MDQVKSQNRGAIILAFFAIYIIWGSTYLGIRFGIESWPPFMLSGLRFIVAGGVLFGWARWKGEATPALRQWRNSLIVGALLITAGNGLVTDAEKSIASAVAALGIAVEPLFVLIFSFIWGHRNTKLEWMGILLGFIGMVVLTLGHNLRSEPFYALLILIAAASWAFGSMWSSHLSLPKGIMGMATQMLMGGLTSMTVSLVSGERLVAMPTVKSWLAIIYLTVFGSLIAFSAYLYLWPRVRPAAAISYAYVNPVIAMLLGVWLGNEKMGSNEWWALGIIVGSVVLISFKKKSE